MSDIATTPDTPPAAETSALAVIPPAPRKKNALRIRELVALHDWVLRNAASCRVVTDTILAQTAAAELGFPITSSNVAGMRGECGIEKAAKDTPPSVEERLNAAEQQLATITQRLESLELHCFGENPRPPADHPVLPGMAAE